MSTPSGSIYLCVKQFNARLGDEILLKIGDKIEVLADDSEYNDGWYMGRNYFTNEVGLYPKAFTQLLHTPKNTLLRSRSRRVASSTSLNMMTDGVANIALSSPTTGTSNNDPYSDTPPTPPQKDKVYGDGRSNLVKNNGSVLRTMSDIDQALEDFKTSKHQEKPIQSTYGGYYPKNDQKKQSQLSLQNLLLLLLQLQLPKNETEKQISGSSNHPYTPSGLHHQRMPSSNLIAEDLDPTQAITWTPQQVTRYFGVVLGFDMDVAGNFARHQISGEILFQLNLQYLKEIDIDSFGTRFQIHKEIEKLKKLVGSKGMKKEKGRGDSEESVSTPVANSTPTTSVTESDANHAHSNENGAIDTDGMLSKVMLPDSSYPFSKNEDDKLFSKSSTMLMPSAQLEGSVSPSTSSVYKHQRKLSQSLDNLSAFGTPMEDRRKSVAVSTPLQLFASPRRAPEPPSISSPINGSYEFGEKLPTGLGILGRPTSLIYDHLITSGGNGHRRNSLTALNSAVGAAGHHRRHSSLFLFLLNAEDLTINESPKKLLPGEVKTPSRLSSVTKQASTKVSSTNSRQQQSIEVVDIDSTTFSPKKLKLVSVKPPVKSSMLLDDGGKRAVLDNSPSVSRLKTLRSASTQNFRNLTSLKKSKTLAFQEGIRQITPHDAIKSSSYSGWMLKKLSLNIGWRLRYFTLHGTRLSYFTSLKDKRERGLIDITAHKVLPVNNEEGNNDKYIAMYALSTGYGLYCFKVVPPAPGFKKGLTFTQPKTHYFAVETQEEMRGWLKALMQATIDIDDTVPIVLSCQTPTVSLARAQELLAKAREETKLRDEELRSQGYLRDGFEYDENDKDKLTALGISTPGRNGSNNDNILGSDKYGSQRLEEVFLSEENLPLEQSRKPTLLLDTVARHSSISSRTPTTPQILGSGNGGFASPYLLALGLLSPKLGHLSTSSVGTNSPVVGHGNLLVTKLDYFNTSINSNLSQNNNNSEDTVKSTANSSGRVVSGSSLRRKNSGKMLAYSNDGSGNHSFVIKQKTKN